MSPTEVSLPRLLALAAGLLAAACGASSSGSTTETARLLSVSPAGGSVSSSTTPTVMIRFSSAMKSGMEQYVDLHDGTIAGPIIPMHCTMAADRTAISCTPDHPLAAHGTSILHIGAGMMDADGRMVSDSAGLGMGGLTGSSCCRRSLSWW